MTRVSESDESSMTVILVTTTSLRSRASRDARLGERREQHDRLVERELGATTKVERAEDERQLGVERRWRRSRAHVVAALRRRAARRDALVARDRDNAHDEREHVDARRRGRRRALCRDERGGRTDDDDDRVIASSRDALARSRREVDAFGGRG